MKKTMFATMTVSHLYFCHRARKEVKNEDKKSSLLNRM